MKLIKIDNYYLNIDYLVLAEIHQNDNVTLTFTNQNPVTITVEQWEQILDKAKLNPIDPENSKAPTSGSR